MPEDLELDAPSDSSPRGGSRRVTRRMLAISLISTGGLAAGAALLYRARAARTRARVASLCAEVYASLRAGLLGRACKLAADARALDPPGREPALAWLHATGLSLLDDTGGAREAVGFVDEARRLGADGTDFAFATLVGAVAVRNDKLAVRIVAQHEDQGIAPDAFYHFARGAALDLACDRGAAAEYEHASLLWADSVLPAVRLARAHLLRGRLHEARVALEVLPPESIGRRVLEAAATRLAGGRAKAAPFGSAVLDEAPRSLRPLGLALLVSPDDPSAAIDAALDDVDTPLAAVACGKLALAGGDVEAAQSAAETALRMRPDLPDAAGLAVRVALTRGDLAGAKRLAASSLDPVASALVAGVVAYEDKSSERIRDAVEAAMDAGGSPWAVASLARSVLGDGTPVAVDRGAGKERPPLWQALEDREPWADVVLFDAAFAAGDLKVAELVVSRWKELTPPRAKRKALLAGKPAAP